MFDIIKAAEIAEKLEEEKLKTTLIRYLQQNTIRESLELFGFQSLIPYQQKAPINNNLVIDEMDVPRDSLLLFGYDKDLNQTPQDYLLDHKAKLEKDTFSVLYQDITELEARVFNFSNDYPLFGFFEFLPIALTDEMNYDISLPIAKPAFVASPLRDVLFPKEYLNIAYLTNVDLSFYIQEWVQNGLVNPRQLNKYSGLFTTIFPIRVGDSSLPEYKAMDGFLAATLKAEKDYLRKENNLPIEVNSRTKRIISMLDSLNLQSI